MLDVSGAPNVETWPFENMATLAGRDVLLSATSPATPGLGAACLASLPEKLLHGAIEVLADAVEEHLAGVAEVSIAADEVRRILV